MQRAGVTCGFRGRAGVALLFLTWTGEACTSLHAQEVTRAPASVTMAGVAPGDVLRIHRGEGATLLGRLEALHADSLLLVSEAGADLSRTWLPLSSLETVEIRGRATRKGAWILGISGAVLGGLTGAAFHGLCESDCGTRGEVALTLGAFGGLAGGILGAIVGAAFPSYRQVWP